MKTTYLYHWLAAATVAASLPVTPARAMSGHSGGGFGEVELMVHLDADLVISLDPGTMFVTIGSLIADSLITTGPTLSFVIIAVSFSVSTLLPLVFPIGGTPTTITDTLMVTPLTITRLYTTTTGIGTVYPLQCKRSLPGAVTTTDRLMERSAPRAAKPFDLFKRPRVSR